MLLVSSFYTGAFTHRSFYAQKLSHTHTHRGFYTEKSLHRGAPYTTIGQAAAERLPASDVIHTRAPLAVAPPPSTSRRQMVRAARNASSRPRWALWTPCPAPFNQLESKAIGASAVLVYPAPRWRCCEERGFPL